MINKFNKLCTWIKSNQGRVITLDSVNVSDKEEFITLLKCYIDTSIHTLPRVDVEFSSDYSKIRINYLGERP